MKNIIEEQIQETKYYQEQYQNAVKEKDKIRATVEGFVSRSSGVESNITREQSMRPDGSLLPDLAQELENVENEKKKLRVSLVQRLQLSKLHDLASSK